VGQDGILRPVADEQPRANSADAIGAQDSILPHNFSQFLTLGAVWARRNERELR
jgi:hypothetical protein